MSSSDGLPEEMEAGPRQRGQPEPEERQQVGGPKSSGGPLVNTPSPREVGAAYHASSGPWGGIECAFRWRAVCTHPS